MSSKGEDLLSMGARITRATYKTYKQYEKSLERLGADPRIVNRAIYKQTKKGIKKLIGDRKRKKEALDKPFKSKFKKSPSIKKTPSKSEWWRKRELDVKHCWINGDGDYQITKIGPDTNLGWPVEYRWYDMITPDKTYTDGHVDTRNVSGSEYTNVSIEINGHLQNNWIQQDLSGGTYGQSEDQIIRLLIVEFINPHTFEHYDPTYGTTDWIQKHIYKWDTFTSLTSYRNDEESINVLYDRFFTLKCPPRNVHGTWSEERIASVPFHIEVFPQSICRSTDMFDEYGNRVFTNQCMFFWFAKNANQTDFTRYGKPYINYNIKQTYLN